MGCSWVGQGDGADGGVGKGGAAMSANYDIEAARIPLTDEDYARIAAIVPQTGFVSASGPWCIRTDGEEDEVRAKWNARKRDRAERQAIELHEAMVATLAAPARALRL